MNQSRFATWLTALSTLVGVLAFITVLFFHYKSSRVHEVTEWQRVVVYGIVQQASGATFEEIKMRYLAAAQQIAGYQLRNRDIQDGSLLYVLLSLQKDRVITLNTDKKYRAIVDPLGNPMDTLRSSFAPLTDQAAKQNAMEYAKAAITRFLWQPGGSGKFTAEELYQQMRSDEAFDLTLTNYYNTLNELRSRYIVRIDNTGLVWAAADMPAQLPSAAPAATAPKRN